MNDLKFLVLTLVFAMNHQQGLTAKPMKPEVERDPNLPAPREMVEIDGLNFYFGLRDWVVWTTAYTKCQNMSMQLFTPDSAEKYERITNWISNNPEPAYDNWWWTAGYKPSWTPDWRWSSTNEVFNYTAWAFGQPSRDPGDESCADFAVWFGGWDDDTCTIQELQYICEEVPA